VTTEILKIPVEKTLLWTRLVMIALLPSMKRDNKCLCGLDEPILQKGPLEKA